MARNANTALVNSTSTGIKYCRSTFVETKVAPHIICVPQASIWPVICFLSCVMVCNLLSLTKYLVILLSFGNMFSACLPLMDHACSIRFSSGKTVHSIVIKHKLPPITLETGSARNTPSVPICSAYGMK